MANLMWALALQEESGGGGGAIGAIFGMGFLMVMLAFTVLMIASVWKIFSKAGEPGWASIVPFYNMIVMLKIGGKPIWWIILFLIPIVSIIMAIILSIAIAEKFGKGTGFGLGMAFLPFIFLPMLAFGDAEYRA